jgi:hypothetical protein
MNPTHKHTEAATFLLNHAVPSEEKIDAMSDAEVAQYLSDNGINVPVLKDEIASLQKKLSGKALLAQARQARLSRTKDTARPDVSLLSEEQMMNSLIEKYGRVEDIPLAARNLTSFKRQELESLYTDLILRSGKGGAS